MFISSGNWRGKHNSLSRGAGADQPGSLLWSPEAFSRRWVNRQRPYKGRGGPVEPATVAKVEGSGGPRSGIRP